MEVPMRLMNIAAALSACAHGPPEVVRVVTALFTASPSPGDLAERSTTAIEARTIPGTFPPSCCGRRA